MSLLERMEKVNPKESVILTYDAWRLLMNDVGKLERVAKAAYAYDYCNDDDIERKGFLLQKMRKAIQEADLMALL